MKKLSEYKDGEALEMLAEIIEPVTLILADKKVMKEFKKTKIKGVSYILKNHKEQIIPILATLEGVPEKDYHCNIVTLPKVLIEIMNDKDLVDFFGSQLPTSEDAGGSSGSATENTAEEER